MIRTRFLLLLPFYALLIIFTGQEAFSQSNLRDEPAYVGSNSGQPFLAARPNGGVFLSWIEKSGEALSSLKYAEWEDGVFGDPQTIASGENWFVNWADVPSITFVGADNIVAHWLEKSGDSRYAYGVRVAISTDRGASWSSPRWLHDDLSETEHGFAVLQPTTSGDIVTAWLDGRKYATGTNEMSLRGRLITTSGSLSEEKIIDPLVCDCCPMSATRRDDGSVVVAYRNRSRDEVRDIYTVTFDGTQWGEPVNVHSDLWTIAGCPVNGPSIDANQSGTIISWFTMASGEPRVLAAFASPDGKSYSSPVQIDTGRAVGRTSTQMLDDGSALVLWIENTQDDFAILFVRRLSNQGLADPVAIGTIASSRSAGVPRMLVSGNIVHFAWTDAENGRIATRTIPLTDL